MRDLKYLQLLSKSFPTISAASTEIINLEAILNLPKGTEHFLTDIHGEHEAFQHVLKNASGVIRKKVEDIFGHRLREWEKRELCTLIYYPEEKLKVIKAREKDIEDWYRMVLLQLLSVLSNVSSKYTRSKVRKALPPEFSYIIQELLHEFKTDPNKQDYVHAIIATIVTTGRAENFIVAMSRIIQRLTIDHLHIVGDIYDRGPGAHIIMDLLCDYHNFDIQWGNHDLVWMGAASGSEACIANVLRMSLRYGNLSTLEDGYGINLLPLATFAMEVYGEDPCSLFKPKAREDEPVKQKHMKLVSQMHKAIAIIQFKLEGQVIDRNPEFGMDDRKLLQKIDFNRWTISLDGKEFQLRDTLFPTIDPSDPYRLTDDEREVMDIMKHYFTHSEKLRKHMRCIYANGSLYLVKNSNLLYHGSVPLNEDGTFKKVKIKGVEYSGKSLFDKVDQIIRQAYFEEKKREKLYATDFIWYLWCGPSSPPFDKDRMTTFERYFIAEKETHKESKGHYYQLKNNREICEMILNEFGVEDSKVSHIINGHIPVKTAKGESPIKAGGKLLVIDGGYSKAYQPETGIAGYTLIYNSHGLMLVQHEPFESARRAIEEGHDIISETTVLEFSNKRRLVRDTDIGAELMRQIEDLTRLLAAYRSGYLKEDDN